METHETNLEAAQKLTANFLSELFDLVGDGGFAALLPFEGQMYKVSVEKDLTTLDDLCDA